MHSFLHMLDKFDAAKVHVVVFVAKCPRIMNIFRRILLRLAKLTGAKQKSQMLVIVETPDAVRPCWLQIVGRLQFAHQNQISLEDLVHCRK